VTTRLLGLTLIDSISQTHSVEATVSIVRIGMSEDKKFADGYEAIFGKKQSSGISKAEKKPIGKKPTAKKPAAKKKTAAKKPPKK
jgi:hypothetical protein